MHLVVQEWKHSCYVHCLAPVLELISQPNWEYTKVLELDAKIRDFSVPTALRARNPQHRSFLMQKASLTTAIETGRWLIIDYGPFSQADILSQSFYSFIEAISRESLAGQKELLTATTDTFPPVWPCSSAPLV